jgi:dihydroxy-acid dehydratase
MDPRNLEKQREPEEPRYLSFRHLPDGTMRDGKLALNKYSSSLTNGHDFPGAQVTTTFLFFEKLSPNQ